MIYLLFLGLAAWVIFMSLAVYHLIDRVNGLQGRLDEGSRLACQNRKELRCSDTKP